MAEFAMEVRDGRRDLVCRLSGEERTDSFALGMIQNNEMPGILVPVQETEDGTELLRFPVGSAVSFAERFTGGISKEAAVRALLSLTETMISAEQYMLSGELFLLQPKMLFMDPVTDRTMAAYLPVEGYQSRMSLKKCLQRVLGTAVYAEDGDLSYVARILNALNAESGLNLYRFRDLLRTELGTPEEDPVPEPVTGPVTGDGFQAEAEPVITADPVTAEGAFPVPEAEPAPEPAAPPEPSVWAPAAQHEINFGPAADGPAEKKKPRFPFLKKRG